MQPIVVQQKSALTKKPHEFEQVDLKDKFSPVVEVYDNAKNQGDQGQ